MYRTILVPLDGSKRAEAILAHVEELALCFKARVVLMQVVEPVPLLVGPDVVYPVPYPQEHERRMREAADYLDSLQGEFREKGLEVSTCLGTGAVVAEIIDAAEREGADLIAMASHGRTGLAQVFYGSVAAGVLHRIDRPLLLIRSLGSD